jgi:hypothetical protein
MLKADLIEVIAEAVHDAWWEEKKKQGVTDHPDMIPYRDLAENIKEYDRVTAQTVIKALNNFNVINNDDWIKQSERLPEYGERVLVSLDNFVCEVTYKDSIFRRDDLDDILGEKVLAWMPLPKPYSN